MKILAEKKLALLEERASLKEEIYGTKRDVKPVETDKSLFWNILLLVILVLIAGGLIAERELGSRYAIPILLVVAILIFKILDTFKKE